MPNQILTIIFLTVKHLNIVNNCGHDQNYSLTCVLIVGWINKKIGVDNKNIHVGCPNILNLISSPEGCSTCSVWARGRGCHTFYVWARGRSYPNFYVWAIGRGTLPAMSGLEGGVPYLLCLC